MPEADAGKKEKKNFYVHIPVAGGRKRGGRLSNEYGL